MGCGDHVAGECECESAGMAEEAGKEEGGDGFGDHAAADKDETDFGVAVCCGVPERRTKGRQER